MQSSQEDLNARKESISSRRQILSSPYKRELTGFLGKSESMGTVRSQGLFSHRQKSLRRKQPEPLRRAVADCLSASHSLGFTSEAVLTFQDYLANPASIHSAYTVLIEHAVAERGRSPPVIMKCVSLLKRYLFRYIPPTSTLQQIDSFCASLIAECTMAMYKRAPSGTQSSNPLPSSLIPRITATSSTPDSTSSVFASEALLKSLMYVRAVVARHLPGDSFLSSSTTGRTSKPYKPSLSTYHRSFSRSYLADDNLGRESVEGKSSVETSLGYLSNLNNISDENQDFIAANFLKWHWVQRKGKQTWAPSPVMMDSGGIARPHVEHVHNLEKGAASLLFKAVSTESVFGGKTGQRMLSFEAASEQLLRPSAMTTITEPAATKSHLRAVAASKRLKSQSAGWDGDTSANTVRRRPRPLFQYRYYSEQQPLRLSGKEIEEVITAACSVGASASSAGVSFFPIFSNNQTGNIHLETADIAASVLIKLLIDMYIADSWTSAPLTLFILEEMLSSSVKAIRIRAFDLMLNLGIHAHLLEPFNSEDNGDAHVEPMSKISENGSISSSLSDVRTPQGTPAAVAEFEAWLLKVLGDMLLFLVQVEEQEEGVWAAALSTLFYLICDRGRIRRKCLSCIDIRVLKSLLEVSRQNCWAEDIHCQLVQMASNSLFSYISEDDSTYEQVLDFDKLEMMGGIEAICTEYAAVNSVEAKHNFFVVLFDYVLAQIKHEASVAGKLHPSVDEIQAIATVLVMAEAPEAVSIALREGLQVGEFLMKSIRKALARDIVNGRLNALLLEEITGLVDQLVIKHTSLDDEFQELASKMSFFDEFPGRDSMSAALSLDGPSTTGLGWAALHALLHSSQPNCRGHGYSWILKLFNTELERAASKEYGCLGTQSLQNHFDLLEKSSADVLSRISPAVRLLCSLLKSPEPAIRHGFILVLERFLSQYERIGGCRNASENSSEKNMTMTQSSNLNSNEFALGLVSLMNSALWQVISANDTHHSTILQMCNLMFSQLCLKCNSSAVTSDHMNQQLKGVNRGRSFNGLSNSVPPANEGEPSRKSWDKSMIVDRSSSGSKDADRSIRNHTKLISMSTLLLQDEAAAPKLLVASIPTALLYWPLMQLSGAPTEDVTLGVAVGSRGGGNVSGGVSDVRGALLLLLIGKCIVQPGAFEDVGGEEFFRLLLDDCDARVSYYSSSFLLKRMMNEEPEKYQRILHNLVFKAQQSNNEKLLENPYLQMRGILQLSSDTNKSQAYLPYDG